MKAIQLIPITLACLFGVSSAQTKQPQTIDLWPDGGSGFPSDFNHQKIDKKSHHLTETSQPYMQIFLADPVKATGASMLVLPGGGYSMLAYGHEGEQVAQYFANEGITCFVVCYRVTKKHQEKAYQFPGPLLDVRQAMRYVRSHSKELKIDPKKVGVIGFSAGGHLAGMVATRYGDTLEGDPGKAEKLRPAFAALIYPVVSMVKPNTHKGSRNGLLGKNPSKEAMEAASSELRVTKDTPPLFIAHDQLDRVTSQNSLLLAMAATKAKVPCELHLYPAGKHGFGLAQPDGKKKPQPASAWPEALVKFIKR